MATVVRAIRGATTVDTDNAEEITQRVQELTSEVLRRNDLDLDDLISIFITATSDISAKYPAAAARGLGLDDVPLLGAQELDVDGMLPRCIRMLVHVNTKLKRSDIEHVYLHEARRLRVDLVK